LNPEVSGRNDNDAVSGARMNDGPGQARRAVDQTARYVTILLGANDGDPIAEFVWDVANICQSLLSPARTDADRQSVRSRNIEFNAVLQQECAKYSRCRFDDNAVSDYQFSRADVSKLDYFHPSLTGQAHLAEVTWNASWWG